MPLSPPVRFAPRRRSKSAYFGDLHVHTRYSSDAYLLGTCARLFGTCARRTTPTVFANGEVIQHAGTARTFHRRSKNAWTSPVWVAPAVPLICVEAQMAVDKQPGHHPVCRQPKFCTQCITIRTGTHNWRFD